MSKLLLNINNLSAWFVDKKNKQAGFFSKKIQSSNTEPLLKKISVSINKREVVGLAGASGSGKTSLALAILRIFQGKIDPDSKIEFLKENLIELPEKELQKRIRGQGIGMIFQDARASLNPVRPIGKQIMDVLVLHSKLTRKESMNEAKNLLQKVDIAVERFNDFPHQFSGGEAQRIAIAKAIAPRPKLLLADEPTTSLDLTTQKKIVDLLIDLKEEFNMSILFISHSLLLLASGICDRIVVLHQGEIVEEGKAEEIFENPRNKITKALKASIPKVPIRERSIT